MSIATVIAIIMAIVFMVWAWTLVARAGITSPGVRLLWYAVIFSAPFFGALLALYSFRKRPARESPELRATKAIAEAHLRKNETERINRA